MVIPHIHERPAGTGVLQVRVEEIRAVERSVFVDRGGHVQVADLLSTRVPDQVSQPPVVHPLRAILRIPDHLVDEVAQM